MAAPDPAVAKWRPLFFLALVLWMVLLTAWMNIYLARLQAAGGAGRPFGVMQLPDGQWAVQDFSYQMIFFRGIRDRELARPYTMPEQEALVRRELPMAQSGMTHAYSPVAYVLALPLIATPGQGAYLIYTVLSALGLVLLFRFALLPRVESMTQLAALGVCVFSVCLIFGVEVGQSAILTTTLLGALWALLSAGRGAGTWTGDLLLALLFWALCLKPSVAIVPAALLAAMGAWRALALGALLLLATWAATCSHYGGWWTGLRDYSQLLNNYNNAGMSAFLRRGQQTAASFHRTELLFSINRVLLLGLSAALVLLRWLGRVTPSELFQGLVWVFVLFSPYLLPSELWILVLPVVEGSFFGRQSFLAAALKVLLLAAVLDLRDGMFPLAVNYPLKCALAAWVLCSSVAAVSDRRWNYSSQGEVRRS